MHTIHLNKKPEDQIVLLKICSDILASNLSNSSLFVCDKEYSDEYAAVFVDGRDREINSIEDLACFKSFKFFSQKNYPIFAFVHNVNNFLNNNMALIENWRINIIPISKLNSLEEYSEFCIKKLYFELPLHIEKLLTIQPDGMLCKCGWEDFIESNSFDYISSCWQHNAAIIFKEEGNWFRFNTDSVNIGNGAFSFRKASIMRAIAKNFAHLTLAEYGRTDFRQPMEDLFFNFFGQNYGYFKKFPTRKQCNTFSVDPITLEQFNNKTTFGFHYPIYV